MIEVPFWVIPTLIASIFLAGIGIGTFTMKFMSKADCVKKQDACQKVQSDANEGIKKLFKETKTEIIGKIGELWTKHDETQDEIKTLCIAVEGLKK